MIQGSEVIYYTPVEAYGVTTFADGIISGGGGNDTTISQSVRFFWVYDPSRPNTSPSGFTGMGWFENTQDTPIWLSEKNGILLEDILDQFSQGIKTNLNQEFQSWNSYVIENSSLSNDIVGRFQRAINNYDCWQNVTNQ